MLAIGLIRLAGFIVRFGQESLQMDFSAFYTAGESINKGLSPYENHIMKIPPVWDGVCEFKHSRFLYPPLVATIFSPLSLFSYSCAKHIWMIFTLLAIAYGLHIVIRVKHLKLTTDGLLFFWLFVTLFYPLLTLLERGQVDGITFALIMLAICLMDGDKKRNVASGLILSLSVLLKLHCLLIIPFLFLRRKWNVLAGYGIGLALLSALSLAVNGKEAINDYFCNQLPRISKFGEGGSGEMRLPSEVIDQHRVGMSSEQVQKDGRIYQRSSFQFVGHASLVRVVGLAVEKIGLSVQLSLSSLCIFLPFFFLMLYWERYKGHKTLDMTPFQELLYWQVVLVIILLSSPVGWVMNTVWLIPTIAIVLHEYAFLADKKGAFVLCICFASIVLAALPDHIGFPMLFPYAGKALNAKYIVSEILLLFSMLMLLSNNLKMHPLLHNRHQHLPEK
jgi:hypothetical protein